MTLSTRVLVGLGAGMAVGALASRSASPTFRAIAMGVEPIGTLFINAIRMTVIPLVVSSLVVGVASASDMRLLRQIGVRAAVLFVALVAAATVFAVAIAVPVLARLPIDPSVSEALLQNATGSDVPVAEQAKALPGIGQWVVDLVPPNPIKAAADGSMLPLIVFSLALGFALAHVEPRLASPITTFFQGLASAMMILVHWILTLAPIGVFALAVPLATRMGIGAVGALAYYVVLAVTLTVVFLAFVLYPITAVAGRIKLSRFARECAPAQVVAFSSRSTMASLPAMIEAARRMDVPEHITSFLVPLAASVFRVGSAIGQSVGVLFAAHLYGVHPGAAQLLTIVVTVILTTFTVPGIPGGSIVVMVPIMLAANLPVEGIGILLGADTIPDTFRTTANVTGGVAVARILGSRAQAEEPVTARDV